MRILLTADPEITVPPVGYGGIERIVDALVRQYRSADHTVGLVAHRNSASPAHHKFGWPGTSSESKLDTWQNALALRRAVRAFEPDVLHSFSRLVYLLPLLPTRLPKIMSYQRHTGGSQISWAARLGGASLRFTGCSDFICSMGRPHGGEWRPIPNFVELDKLTFVAKVAPDAPLVFLSRIEAIKGPEIAIAVARASGRRLILAGNYDASGVHRDFWEREIAPQLGRNGIEFIGEVNDRQKNELLGSAAAMIVPIQWDEPFGIVFPEALACGTPVIACPRGALPEILTEGRNGFFMNSVADGVAAVNRLANVDRAFCRRTAEEQFSLAVCSERYLELYREMTVT